MSDFRTDFYVYPDGFTLPSIRGGQNDVPDPPSDDEIGGGDDGESVIGRTILINGKPTRVEAGPNGQPTIKAPSGATITLPPGGPYVTPEKKAFQIGADGKIVPKSTVTLSDSLFQQYAETGSYLPQDAPTPSGEYAIGDVITQFPDGTALIVTGFDANGEPKTSLRNIGTSDGGGGGGGGGFSIVGSKAPDPLGALNFLLDKYVTMVRNDQIPVDNAIEQFNAAAKEIELQQSQAINQGTFQQAAEGMELDKQLEIERSQRARAEAATNRAMNIQQERGRRAADAQRLLKSSIPNATSMSLPLVGDLPLAQVNPDQFYDIQGLNNIPQIPQEVNPDLMGFEPTVPQLPQIPQLPNIPDQPVRPMEETIPPELIDQLLPQIIGGFPGFLVG